METSQVATRAEAAIAIKEARGEGRTLGGSCSRRVVGESPDKVWMVKARTRKGRKVQKERRRSEDGIIRTRGGGIGLENS